jgi:tripartite-type tricarboxylate transporter receptor subunit TctC
MTRTLSLLSFAAWAACAVSPAPLLAQPASTLRQAQDSGQAYPYKPIRFVVGFQPGGGVDMSARTVGQPLSVSLGQSIVVDNRPGAAGNIAAGYVAKATPDGYTLLMSNSTIASPTLFKSLPFDVRKDLDPVGLIAIGPSVLIVHPSVPARNVKELIALARAQPKKLVYGSGGIGNVTHLEMEIMNAMVGVHMTHVPYKGSAPSIVALVSGEVQAVFSSIPSALGQIRAGRIRALGVSILKRSSVLPDVPTLDESGVSGFDAASWYAVFAPAGTPKNVVATLGKEIVRIMNVPDVRERFANDGFEPAGTGPAEFARFLRLELVKWAKAVEMAGVKPE